MAVPQLVKKKKKKAPDHFSLFPMLCKVLAALCGVPGGAFQSPAECPMPIGLHLLSQEKRSLVP